MRGFRYLDRLQDEVALLRKVAHKAEEAAAWFNSGNSVPVDVIHAFKTNGPRIMADIAALNEAIAAAKEHRK